MTDLRTSDLQDLRSASPPARPLAAADHAVPRRRARRGVAAPAGAALCPAAHRRADARRHHRRRPDAFARRNRTAGAHGARRSRKDKELFRFSSACPAATPRALLDTLARTAAWPIDGYLISCPYYSRPSQRGLELHFQRARRSRQPSDGALQHPLPDRRQSRQRGDAAARRPSQYRGPEGLLRGPQPVDRAVAPASAGFRRADRRGCTISGSAERRRRRRHPGVGACRDRRSSRKSYRLQAAGERDAALALWRIGRGPDATAVRRAEPGADQALAVADRIDRQRGGTTADDGGERGAGRRIDREIERRARQALSPRSRGAKSNTAQSSRVRASRSALPITLTDDSAIAAAPIIGDSRMPNTG